MNRLLRNDLEAEAITLDSEATRMMKELKDADLPENELTTAMRTIVEPRVMAAQALRNAIRAMEQIPPMTVGKQVAKGDRKPPEIEAS